MSIRSHTTLVEVFPLISSIATTRLSPLGPRMTEFAGRFTLPFNALWGQMLLPEGDYTLYFGTLGGGMCCVEILGAGQGSSQGIYLVREQSPASIVQNALVCTYKRGRHTVRALELPAIGKSVSFSGPNARNPMERRLSSREMRLAAAPA